MRLVLGRTALAALGLLAAFGSSAPVSLSAQNITAVAIQTSAGNDSTYAPGDWIEVRVTWSADPTQVSGAQVYLPLTIGSTTRQACFSDGTACPAGSGDANAQWGTGWVQFSYQVREDDKDADGISISGNITSDLNLGSLDTNHEGQPARVTPEKEKSFIVKA